MPLLERLDKEASPAATATARAATERMTQRVDIDVVGAHSRCMRPEDIADLLNAQPFQPFTVFTNDGRSIFVGHRELAGDDQHTVCLCSDRRATAFPSVSQSSRWPVSLAWTFLPAGAARPHDAPISPRTVEPQSKSAEERRVGFWKDVPPTLASTRSCRNCSSILPGFTVFIERPQKKGSEPSFFWRRARRILVQQPQKVSADPGRWQAETALGGQAALSPFLEALRR